MEWEAYPIVAPYRMTGAPASISTRATLCPSGMSSRRGHSEPSEVPALRPPSVATMATLSRAFTWMNRGQDVCEFGIGSLPLHLRSHRNLQFFGRRVSR